MLSEGGVRVRTQCTWLMAIMRASRASRHEVRTKSVTLSPKPGCLARAGLGDSRRPAFPANVTIFWAALPAAYPAARSIRAGLLSAADGWRDPRWESGPSWEESDDDLRILLVTQRNIGRRMHFARFAESVASMQTCTLHPAPCTLKCASTLQILPRQMQTSAQ